MDLPIYQFNVSNLSCGFVSNYIYLQQSCQVKSVTSDAIKTRIELNHPCSVPSCINSTYMLNINGMNNLYADTSSSNISFFQNGYASEIGILGISPNIIAPQLNNVITLLSSNIITQNNTVSISFSCPLNILMNSQIKISLGDLVFLRNNDCVYSIGNTNYSGCSFGYSSNNYVQSITLNSLGNNIISANTPINIQLFMINAYSTFNIFSSSFNIDITTTNFTIANYATTMGNILKANSFTPATLTTTSIARNTTQVNSPVLLSFSINVPVNFYYNTNFSLMISKD